MVLYDNHYIIGIDLGTTNSAVSYVDLTLPPAKKPRIKLFKVPQLTGPGEFSSLPVLPSFLYIPGTYDISKEAVLIPWKNKSRQNNDHFVGAFARDHGAKVPARLVSSAKSWLCHSNVDRKARILPWGAGDDVFKVSPVNATASYLKHIINAWNSNKGDDEELYLENQMIVLTVPASFDEVARELTVEAASAAGLRNVTLLEEPLAAFYNWLIRHEDDWSEYVKPDELVLVCDVGGGTTDFTLITLREVDGNPRFERIAVGNHLVLGGDNIDLALARGIEMRLGKKTASLSPDRWKALCHECRQAKEIILGGSAESKKITLMGEGSKLIAETISVDLSRKEVEKVVVEGFFPLADSKTGHNMHARKGITEFGLPYEQEPAITRHLGWFMERHKADVMGVLDKDNHMPDLILFNGGSLKPSIIQERIRVAVRHWFNEKDVNIPRVLENPDPDLAVAFGASYYGLVKMGRGVRVGSGSARGYYLGIAKEAGETCKRENLKNGKRHAVCLVERGLHEGTTIELKDKKFEVLANQPVTFDIYSSSFRSGDKCGDIIDVDDSLSVLPPLQTVIQYGKKGVRTAIPIKIEAGYTELGTLSLWCCSLVSDHRWRLQFQLRDISARIDVSDKEVFAESTVKQVDETVRKAFLSKKDNRLLETLTRDITAIVERSRDKWPLGFIRNISDTLLDIEAKRGISPEHEGRWLNFAGFCLRPGFGDGFDEHRLQKLWKIHKQGPVYSKNAQVCAEWWILWRRVAGGLKAGRQRQFFQEIIPLIMPKKGTKIKISPQEHTEAWMAVANMERLLVKDKIRLGQRLVSELKPKKCKSHQFWALSRIGARELLYGSADRVVPPGEVSSWIKTILDQNWRNPKPVCRALSLLARKTGDRARDIDDSLVESIADWMSQYDSCVSDIRFIKDVVPIGAQEKNIIFGETLPAGIVLYT